MRPTRTAAAVIAAAGLLFTATTTGSARAASPRDVDPSTVMPALNPTFDWECARTGQGILCTGERRTTYGPEPAGFDCDGREVWVSGRGDDHFLRWHTDAGLATRGVVQRSFPLDVLTLSADGSGPAVTSRQHWTQHYLYGVPGDTSTRQLTETGQVLVVHGPDGKLLQVTGLTRFAPGADFDVVVAEHGRNDFSAGADFVEEVCAALT